MLEPINPKIDKGTRVDPKDRNPLEKSGKAADDGSGGYRFNMYGKRPQGEKEKKKKKQQDDKPVNVHLSEAARKFLEDQKEDSE